MNAQKSINRDDYPYLVTKFLVKGYSSGQVTEILEIVMNTCHECWEAPSGCQCWNDE